jgi:hypothetical protein
VTVSPFQVTKTGTAISADIAVPVFFMGAFVLKDANFNAQRFVYEVDGNYGDYTVNLALEKPVKKRQALIDEFTTNPQCRVFLSADAGGTGLNLQAADCVANFELPWNPAKMKQRIGRVNRIGQKSKCINLVNLIAKCSIEEKILAGIQLGHPYGYRRGIV